MSVFFDTLATLEQLARQPDDLDADDDVWMEGFLHHDRLTKPPGSLGALEFLGVQLGAIAGQVPPPVPGAPAVAVFAGDHGVVDEGVSAWPREVTAQMVANMLGGGAAVNALARQMGAELIVVDVGVEAEIDPHPRLRAEKIRPGTRNLRHEDAMTRDEVERALDVGCALAHELVAGGADLLIAGDMGIGNTTPAAALIAALGSSRPFDVVGRGAGSDDRIVARKIDVLCDALERVALERVEGVDDPFELLGAIGGFELAAVAGFAAGAAASRVPFLIDGITPQAATAWLYQVEAEATATAIAAHRTVERGGDLALACAGYLEPLLDLELRLGEGTGALLAVPLVQAAARVMSEMATFDGAGVSSKPPR